MRILALLLMLVVALPPIILLHVLKFERARGKAVQWFFIVANWVVGLRFTVEGTVSDQRPLMLISNHSSYMDIFIIGAQVPVSFTPKSEIRSWPVIGQLCVLADCIFVERKPTHIQKAKEEMKARLSRGKVLCLFPEGTTSDGKHLKPFKSGFLSLAEAHNLPTQVLTIAYTHIGKIPLSDAQREEVTWVGDATLAGHLPRLLGFPSLKLHLVYEAPLQVKDFEDRKAMTKHAETQVRAQLARLVP